MSRDKSSFCRGGGGGGSDHKINVSNFQWIIYHRVN